MRIAVVGAGPAGLLFSLLVKRQRPQDEIVVVEQNAARRDVRIRRRVLARRARVPVARRARHARDAGGGDGVLAAPADRPPRASTVDIDGNGFSAIARIALLAILRRQCEALGVRVEFERTLESLAPLAGFDLVVGADGVNSLVRRELGHEFQARVEWLTNKFAWYGTAQPFDCLTLTFRTSEHGAFVAHHYRYAPAMSTFIVECDAATWHRAGLDRASDAESRAPIASGCSRPICDGHPLVSNKSRVAQLPARLERALERGEHGADRRCAAHRALLDRIGHAARVRRRDRARARVRGRGRRRAAALSQTFERERRPIVEKLVAAANQSSYWYERMSDKMSARALAARLRLHDAQRPHDRRAAARGSAAVHAHGRCEAGGPSKTAASRSPIPCLAMRPARGDRLRDRRAIQRVRHPVRQPRRGARRQDRASSAASAACTYGELCDAAARAGNGLRRMGLARGGRVLMLLDDTPEYAAAIFGAIRAGFVPVLVNTLSPAELVGVFSAGLRRRGGDRRRALRGAPRARERHARAGCARSCTSATAWPIRAPLVTVRSGGRRGSPRKPATLDCADTHRDEMAFWMYSSGSTGRPKGVVHLQHDRGCTRTRATAEACSAFARTTSCSRRRRSSSPTGSATR